jgi:hypothetical protein
MKPSFAPMENLWQARGTCQGFASPRPKRAPLTEPRSWGAHLLRSGRRKVLNSVLTAGLSLPVVLKMGAGHIQKATQNLE